MIPRPPPDEIADRRQQEIKRLLRFTSRRHPIRRLMDPKTGELIASSDAAAQLCKILCESPSYQWRERSAAALALRHVAMDPVQAQYTGRILGDVMNNTETIAPDAKRKRENQDILHILGLLGIALAGIFVLGIAIQERMLPEWIHKIIFDFGCFAGAASLLWIPALLILGRAQQQELRIECAVTLRWLRQPESVRALAVLARSPKYYSTIAQDALLEILPLLMPDRYEQLEAATVPELNALLRTTHLPPYTPVYSAPLCKATLDALAKIGDGRAVKPVQKLAEKCRTPEVRARAMEVLPTLLARQAQEEAYSNLLRGASAPDAPEKELLRAASASSETAPKLLLRASQAHKERNA